MKSTQLFNPSCKLALTTVVLFTLFANAAPTTAPTTDSKLWEEMKQVDEKAGKIKDITADFEQKKFTPLLKKPLISRGHVLAKGAAALWSIEKPEPSKMSVTADGISIYYPAQSIEEVYPLQGQLGALASSPLPRLEALQKFFAFAKIESKTLDPAATDDKYLALLMTPTDSTIAEHVQDVKVLLDRESGFLVRAENTDADGETTALTFSNVKLDSSISDDQLKLELPPGTKVTKPLEGMGGQQPRQSGVR